LQPRIILLLIYRGQKQGTDPVSHLNTSASATVPIPSYLE